MDITLNRITAAAGIAAAVAGAIFVGVQINHPPADVAHVVTTDVLVREIAKATMAVLALAGLAGMFLHNRHRFGAIGVAGYVLVSIGYFAMFANQVIVACVLPIVARTDPKYVQGYLNGAMGHGATGDIGHAKELFMITGIGYALGGLLFGIALYRAGLLARWASALFAAGTVSALALAVLPESFSRPFAVPVGVALVGLGLSLWRQSTMSTVTVETSSATEPALAR